MASEPAMAAAAARADESDLDPAAFLQSVRELSEKREREDLERYRKLEAEIEKGRQERALRRADRARSISPEKPVHASPASPLTRATTRKNIASPAPLTPTATPPTRTMDRDISEPPAPVVDDVPEFKGFGSAQLSIPRPSSTASPAQVSPRSPSPPRQPSATTLARSGTLSWQQRRSTVRVGGPRPQSTLFTEESERGKTRSVSASREDTEISRDEIAASLGSRDPSWFKQTADRGMGNAAFRKSKDEDEWSGSGPSGRRELPGMSREASVEPVRQVSPVPSESVRSETLSWTNSVRDSVTSSSRFSTVRTSTSSKPDLRSLLEADQAQEKAAPMAERGPPLRQGGSEDLVQTSTLASSLARSVEAPLRPSSPTKGMGGFVQSAMMKRSDSISKRGSTVLPGTSVSRHNSIAGNRSGHGGLAGSHSMPRLERPGTSSKESSAEPVSRPSSRDSTATDLTTATVTRERGEEATFVKPSRAHHHSRSKSVASNFSTTAADSNIERPSTPPASPSKRFSPTKSTWLESAIARPESPKPAAPARNSQPSWMTDIAKAKAQRANGDTSSKPAAEVARSPSPSKALFGPGLLRRNESQDLRTTTPVIDSALTTASVHSPAVRQSWKADTPIRTPSEPAGDSPDELKSSAGLGISSVAPPRDLDATPKKVNAVSNPVEPKTKPQTPPKPPTDFRSNLRPRAPTESKKAETPEFLSKVGNLRRTTTQNYVAPDVLKDNVLRGKAELAKTTGPVKTTRTDEFKDSLQAKKEQWKKDKDEGVVHERATHAPPVAPQKPEALAKRELLGKAQTAKPIQKPSSATPEALARHKSLAEKVISDPAAMQTLNRQTSAPVSSSTANQMSESSKLAARFNPGLAGILARGPVAASNGSNTPSRTNTLDLPDRSRTPSIAQRDEPLAVDAPLEDMRKGRAKGPKRRKGGAKETETPSAVATDSKVMSTNPDEPSTRPREELDLQPSDPRVVEKNLPRAPAGSAASIMMASLQPASRLPAKQAEAAKPSSPSIGASSPKPSDMVSGRSGLGAGLATPSRESLSTKPQTPAKSPSLLARSPAAQPTSGSPAAEAPENDIVEFKGFGSKKASSTPQAEENKENTNTEPPSVRAAASMWGRQSPTRKSQPPPGQIQLPSKKDEEAAMRSAGMLASSPGRPSSRDGLGVKAATNKSVGELAATFKNAPPGPMKSSRAVNGLSQEPLSSKSESNSNRGPSYQPPPSSHLTPNDSPLSLLSKVGKVTNGSREGPSLLAAQSSNDAEGQLVATFGFVPISNMPLMIDTQAALSNTPHQDRIFRTVRKTVHLVSGDGSLIQSPEHEDYTFFDESVYLCTHVYTVANGPKRTEIFLWVGKSLSDNAGEQAQALAKKQAKETGSAFVHTIRQGLEPPGFLQAMGGILVTRKGFRNRASKQYMLCGRKHLGQIVFDEVDFSIHSLCHGFAYLISHPATLQESTLYLWKGSACSSDEVSAARLAAMDLSETGDVIEADGGFEFASFLKIFGSGTIKADLSQPSEFWHRKALAPNKFATRLFRLQPAESKAGIFSSIFTRRPSWNNLSPGRRSGAGGGPAEDEVKAEVKELSPFTQSDLEADNIYLLDAYTELHILVGPVFATLQTERYRATLFSQTLRFAAEYAVLAASSEDRPMVPAMWVCLEGVPSELNSLFRSWNESNGLWGTGGLMAGSRRGYLSERGARQLDVESALAIVCRE